MQLVFSIIVLGIAAYLCSLGDVWWAGMAVFVALFSALWVGANFALYLRAQLLPLAVVVGDAFITLFLLITVAGTGASGLLSSSCSFGGLDLGLDNFDITFFKRSLLEKRGATTMCSSAKGLFAIALLSMFVPPTPPACSPACPPRS